MMLNISQLKLALEQSADTVGMIGVVLLLTAFFLLNTNRINAKQLPYQIMNLSAAILILYSLLFHWNTPSVVIEGAWISISLIGIARIMMARRREVPRNDDNIVPLKRVNPPSSARRPSGIR